MNKVLDLLKSKRVLTFLCFIAIFFIIRQLGGPWYSYVLVYAAIILVYSLLNYGTVIGNLGYVAQVFLNNKPLAYKLYEKAIQHNTKSNYALTAYGLDLLRGGQTEKALDIFEMNLKVKNIKPLFVKYTESNLATCYWKLGDVKKAIEILEGMYEKYEVFTPDFYTTFGYMFIEDGDYEQALYFTKEALHDNREHGPAYDNMGQIYFRQGEYEKASRYFRKGLKYKTMADSQYYLGLIAETQGDKEDAKKYFTEAHETPSSSLSTVLPEQIDEKYEQYL